MPATRVYYLHAGWMSFAFSIIFTTNLVYQVEVAELNPLQLVLVGTALELSAFLFEIPTGLVADVYSRRLSVVIGVFITGVAFLVQAVPTFYTIALSSALWGLGYTFTSGAHAAWITDEVGAGNVGPVFLRAAQFRRCGDLAGVPVGIALAISGLQLPLIVGAAAILALCPFLVRWMPEAGFSPAPRGDRTSWAGMGATLREGLVLVRVRPALRDLLLIGLFVGLYSEGFDRLSTPHLLKNIMLPDLFGLDPLVWFGVIRGGSQLLEMAGNEMVRRRVSWERLEKAAGMLQFLYVLMILALGGFAFCRSFPPAVGLLIAFNVCRGLTFPLQDTWTNQFIDSRVRATVLSVQAQVDAFGQTTGGPVLGWVGNRFGVSAALKLAALILLPVVPLYQRTRKRSPE